MGHLIPGMQEEAAQLIDDLITPVEIQQLHPILPIEESTPHVCTGLMKTPTSVGKWWAE
jgi:hypothetical protein